MINKFNNKGLTLIEIIVTLAVLGVVVTPLMNMFIASQKINNESGEEYRTLQIAQNHLEKIKSASDLSSLPSMGYINTGGNHYSAAGGEALPYEVDIIMESESSGEVVSNAPQNALPIVKIYDDTVMLQYDIVVKSYPVENGTVDISMDSGKINVAGYEHFISSNDINVELETDVFDAKLNFINCTVSGNVYLHENEKEWSFEVFGGKTPKIVRVKHLLTGELLYKIEVKVYKGSGTERKLVKSLESTGIFK